LDPSESKILRERDDLISPRYPEEYGVVDQLVTSVFEKFGHNCCMTDTEKSIDNRVLITPPERVTAVSRLIMAVLAALTVSIPMIVLDNVQNQKTKVWLILAFSVIFSCMLSLFTRVRQYEMFSFIAAFCAVMVVFISSNGN